ncbi:phenylacetate--CoA ligase family protein [Thermogemmatispora sp.]|uniref:phenylacetate--CoA ligase family protein n=1 Tax=Thermogemmatispora sp. TaxID=1968838 RepID=UPI0035E3FBEB
MTYPRFYNAHIETMPLEQLRELQLRKLRKQLAYNYQHSAFYRQKFEEVGAHPEDIRTLEDLARLPFTTKEELRDSQLEQPPLGHHAAVPMSRVVRIHSSSGTTGRPSYVGITHHDRDTWVETVARVYWSEGVRPDSMVVMGFGMSFFVGGLPLKDAIEEIGATFVPVGTGASDRLITSIQNLGANQLTCTPSYAIYLAEYVRNKFHVEPRTLGIRRIQLGAEPGGGVPAVRQRIEEDWGAFVTEGIGNADVLPVYAADCDERLGMHFLAPDFAILEVIDPESGVSLPLDQSQVEGELVFTHIDRECCPLVRFRTRDRVIVWTDPCPCGRTGPRLRCVGRTDDLLILRGVNVWPSAIKDVLMGMRPRTTGEVQILLKQPGPRVDPPLHLRVEYGSDVEDLAALKREIEETLREKLIFTAEVELVPPGTLPRFEMKAQLIRKLYEQGR